MLYFPKDFGDLTIDSLIDTSALSSAISEADFEQIEQIAPQKMLRDGPPKSFQIMVATRQLETLAATTELQFEVGDITFVESFIDMAKLPNPLTGLLFLQRSGTLLDKKQGVPNFPYFPCSSKMPIIRT